MLKRLQSKIANMVGRGIAKLLESSGTWQITLASGEVISSVQHPQNFGFFSKAPNGSDAFAAFQAGSRENGFLVVVQSDAGRPEVEQGETALHNEEGAFIVLKKGGIVEIHNAELHVKGNDITDEQGSAQTLQAMRDLFNSHVHPKGTGTNTEAPIQQM